MGVIVKKIVVGISVSALIFGLAPLALAAPANAAAVKCLPTTAIGHEPKKIAKATKILKVMPKTFTLATNCGNIVITTVGKKAPQTLTQLATLAKGRYFDATLCHRLTTQGIFVLQCGDPSASGMGGPGFNYKDENLPPAVVNNYPEGTVAMANSGPGTNGSQFFLVFANTSLPSGYTIWGKITQGLDIVKTIAKAGVKGGGADGSPAQIIAITKVTTR